MVLRKYVDSLLLQFIVCESTNLQFEKLKSMDAKSTFLKNNLEHQRYRDLLKGRFELTKIERIEHKYSQESTSRKTADFSPETINALIKEGESDVQELL